MNVLILDDSVHRGTTQRLCQLLSAHGDSYEILDYLTFISDTLSQTVRQRHSSFRRIVTKLAGSAFQNAEQFQPESDNRKLLRPGAYDLGAYLQSNRFDLIACTHVFAAILLMEALESRSITVPSVIVDQQSAKAAPLSAVADRVRAELLNRGLCAVVGLDAPEQLYNTLDRLTRDQTEACRLDELCAPVKLKAPNVQSALRHQILKMPDATYEASGIIVNGRRLKSFVFSTDLAIIRNCDADAVFAVYPFTPQQAISDAIIKGSFVPVFCGVGGGTTEGPRTVSLAKDVESQGAMGVVLNAPISNPNLKAVAAVVDIPVVITVVNAETNISERLEAGASIINVAGAAETPDIIRRIRESHPDIPIIASGGSTNESIRETIRAGANAITYTPPSTKELFRVTMSKYREM